MIVDVVLALVAELVQRIHERGAIDVAATTARVDVLVVQNAIGLRGIGQFNWCRVEVAM